MVQHDSRVLFLLLFASILFLKLTKGNNDEDFSRIGEDERRREPFHGQDVVLVLFFSLLVGIICRWLLRSLFVPYLALVFLFGIGLGLLQIVLTEPIKDSESVATSQTVDVQGHRRWREFAQGIDVWQGLNPDLLLLIFLPALLFPSTFSTDFHVIKKSLGQVLTLAGPGIVISTVFATLFAKYAFPYGWCWPKAVTFGSIISIIDPSIVVNLLREVGVSRRLAFVIEGESLFQDGTAFVLFILFKDLIPRSQDCLDDKQNCVRADLHGCAEIGALFEPKDEFSRQSILHSVGVFFQLALLGPVIGILCGLIATCWIHHIYNDFLVEISITLSAAYLAFYTADQVAHTSGVLAVVALGLCMGSLAKARISSPSYEPLKSFWEMVDYLATTLIFIFTGLKIAIAVFKVAENEPFCFITWREWLNAIILCLILFVIRAITLCVLFPLLNKIGECMTWKDFIVAVLSGMRGADALALALIVQVDVENMPAAFRAYTIFYVGFVVSATLLFPGTCILLLLRCLGYMTSTEARKKMVYKIVKEMEELGEQEVFELEKGRVGYYDNYKVMNLTKVNASEIYPKVWEKPDPSQNINSKRTREGSHIGQGRESSSCSVDENENDHLTGSPDLRRDEESLSVPTVEEIRLHFYRAVKRYYLRQLEKRCLTASEIFYLIESVEDGRDNPQKAINDWSLLKRMIAPPNWQFRVETVKRFIPGGSSLRFWIKQA